MTRRKPLACWLGLHSYFSNSYGTQVGHPVSPQIYIMQTDYRCNHCPRRRPPTVSAPLSETDDLVRTLIREARAFGRRQALVEFERLFTQHDVDHPDHPLPLSFGADFAQAIIEYSECGDHPAPCNHDPAHL